MTVRIQKIDNETTIEITTTVTEKVRHTESDLIRRKAYFEELIVKGQSGLAEVTSLLNQIENERAP